MQNTWHQRCSWITFCLMLFPIKTSCALCSLARVILSNCLNSFSSFPVLIRGCTMSSQVMNCATIIIIISLRVTFIFLLGNSWCLVVRRFLIFIQWFLIQQSKIEFDLVSCKSILFSLTSLQFIFIEYNYVVSQNISTSAHDLQAFLMFSQHPAWVITEPIESVVYCSTKPSGKYLWFTLFFSCQHLSDSLCL